MQRHEDDDAPRLEDDPEMLRVALGMINALDEDADYAQATAGSLKAPEQLHDDAATAVQWEGDDGQHPEQAHQPKRTHTTEALGANAMPSMGNVPVVTFHGGDCKPCKPAMQRQKLTLERRREETEYLRDKLIALEKTLAALKSHTSAQPSNIDSHAATAMSRVWKEIAGRQQQQRRHAELENAQLRARLRSQLKIGKSLMRLFQRAANEKEQNEPSASARHHLLEHNTRPPSQSQDYHLYVVYLDSIYHQRALVFAAPQFKNGIHEFRDMQLRYDDRGHQTGVDFQIGWALPFPINHVMDAVWHVSLIRVNSKECHMTEFEQLDTPSDVVVMRYRGVSINGTGLFHGDITGSVAMKRYVDPATNEGVVITVWDGILSQEHKKLHFVEKSVTRVQRVPRESGESIVSGADYISHLQVFRQIRVNCVQDAASLPRRQIGLITEFMMSEVDKELTAKQLMIENLLLRSQAEVSVAED